MAGRIYLLNDNSDLMAMEEAPYDSEKLLQEMLAKHPDLLAGEQINSDEPRRWLLVTREMAVQGDEDDSPRWSLDHLFLDQDAVPTLVEVKKGSNTDKDGKRFQFTYEYDFGDCWQHEVIFEGCLRAEKGGRYPVCVEGERACPPEDVGGVWGYAEFLEAIADPKHEQHDDFVEWAGDFDPEEFDAGKTTKAMRRGLPDWRQYR